VASDLWWVIEDVNDISWLSCFSRGDVCLVDSLLDVFAWDPLNIRDVDLGMDLSFSLVDWMGFDESGSIVLRE
jgi:hypothetical protein